MTLLKKYQRFFKFCIVGGSGAIITFGITWILTELVGLWYMASMVIAVAIATIWNYNFNTFWTYRTSTKFSDASYEWESFYNGNPIQKWWKQSIANTIWDWIPPSNGGKILDYGCGSSPIITKYKNATAIDTNIDKLRFMREKFPDIKFYYALYDEGYDNILCIELIEHLNNPSEIVDYLSSRLKPNGKIIFATPDYNKILWHIAEKFTPYKDDHRTKLSKESLESLCSRYGLIPVKSKYIMGCDLVEMFEKR